MKFFKRIFDFRIYLYEITPNVTIDEFEKVYQPVEPGFRKIVLFL